jgi:hypothetical protein
MNQRAGYTWTDYKTNTEIVKELNMTSVLVKNTGLQKKLVATCKQNAS